MDTDDDSAPFDPDVLAETAEEYDVDVEVLEDVVSRHQESMAALPGIENLAYEWRKQYDSPLVERTQTAYHFAVPSRIWAEFGQALAIDDSTLDALVDVHRRTVVARTEAESEPSDAFAYVVLDRTFDDASPD